MTDSHVYKRGPLINTKFLLPYLPHLNFVRARLLPLLSEGLNRKLTLVSAPAGFGKTTLLAAWAQSLSGGDGKVVWLSVDESDNHAQQFWRYFFSAFERVVPGLAESELLYSEMIHSVHIESILTNLINAIASKPVRLLLIIDDYHLISDTAIHDAMNFLLEYLPPQLHLYISTRTDPPFDLSILRAQDQLLEVRVDQLRCTNEEAEVFLRRVMKLDIPQDVTLAMNARTEGWLVGLQLIGLSLRKRPETASDLIDLVGPNRYILDYLTHEVLYQQKDEVQKFLQETSILHRMCASLCDAVTGKSNSQAMLDELERENLFIVPLDIQRHWYRYHALFAEVLQYYLQQEEPDNIPGLHMRASNWFQQAGNIDEAFEHAAKAGAWQKAADLLEPLVRTNAWLHQGNAGKMEHWLRSLPQQVILARPDLCIAFARILFHSGYLKEAKAWLDSIREIPATSAEGQDIGVEQRSNILAGEWDELLGKIASLLALAAGFTGDESIATRMSEKAFEYLPGEDHYPRGTATAARGMAHIARGEMQQAVEDLLQASRLYGKAGDLSLSICQNSLAASLLVVQGNLHEAQSLYQQAIELGTQVSGLSLTAVGIANAYRAEILRERNQLEIALDVAQKGIQMGEQGGYRLFLGEGYITLARIYLSLHNFDAADQAMRQLSHSPLNEENLFYWAWIAQVDQARLWILKGELERASAWDQLVEVEERPQSSFALERQDVARARIRLALSSPEDTLRLLEPWVPIAMVHMRWHNVIEMQLLQALAFQMQGDLASAYDVVTEIMNVAEPRGFIRIFLDEGQAVESLLLGYSQTIRAHADYVNRLLTAFEHEKLHHPLFIYQKATKSQAGKLEEALTPREMEILLWIARGSSNQEIANNLVLSIDTVKHHVSSILAKLNVSNRTQAVVRAREVGLIKED
jgi:LuxR family maltose regulon positive regulatory protein